MIKNYIDLISVARESFYNKMIEDIDVVEIYHAELGITCTLDQESGLMKVIDKSEPSKSCVGHAVLRLNNLDEFF